MEYSTNNILILDADELLKEIAYTYKMPAVQAAFFVKDLSTEPTFECSDDIYAILVESKHIILN